MKCTLLFLFILFGNSLLCCQEISRIEFRHSNAIVPSSLVSISFEPIKTNRKGKVRVKVKRWREDPYIYKISKEQFTDIYKACFKIEYDTVAIKHNILDSSSSEILLTDSLGNKKTYYADALSKRSQTDKSQSDFWYATTLIIKAARLRMKDLIDYW